MIDMQRGGKTLIVGTGGGNDICSTTMIASSLRRLGIEVDIAGICSPAALHHYESGEESTINRVTPVASRKIPYGPGVPISFIDALLPDVCAANGLDVNIFNFSFRYGTPRLIEDLREFVREQKYEALIAVDVGGDILARGAKDSTILSPLMDFASLHVLSAINIPSLLIEFGLQTDGELRPQGCDEILDELTSSGLILATDELAAGEPRIETYRSIYAGIKKIRAGNTVRLFFDTLSADRDFKAIHRQSCRMLGMTWNRDAEILLEKKYFGKMYTIDLKRLVLRRPMAFGFEHPLEQLIRMKLIVDTRTEMDLLYSNIDDVNVWHGLVPPRLQNEAEEIVQLGMDDLGKHADVALIWERDAGRICQSMTVQSVSPFILAGPDAGKVASVAEYVTGVISSGVPAKA